MNGRSKIENARLALTRIRKAHSAAVDATDEYGKPRPLETTVHLLEAAEEILREWLKHQPAH